MDSLEEKRQENTWRGKTGNEDRGKDEKQLRRKGKYRANEVMQEME